MVHKITAFDATPAFILVRETAPGEVESGTLVVSGTRIAFLSDSCNIVVWDFVSNSSVKWYCGIDLSDTEDPFSVRLSTSGLNSSANDHRFICTWKRSRFTCPIS